MKNRIARLKDKIRHIFFLSALLMIFTSSPLYALDSDVGLITKITGKVEYRAESSSRYSIADVFMKIRKGDRIRIHEKSEITMIFQADGQRETWFGPCVVKADDSGCALEEGKPLKQALTGRMPVGVSSSDRIFSAPDNLEDAVAGRGGVRVVRAEGGAESRFRKEMEEYQTMRKQFGENDAAPEMFLITVYSEHQKKDELKKLLESMSRKWPENPYVREWAAKVRQ